MIAVQVKRISKNLISSFEKLHFQFLMLFIPSCGGNKPDGLSEKIHIGFSADYIAPTANFDAPENMDPNFKILEPTLVDPYWISSLEMDNGNNVINQMLFEHDRSMAFSFPSDSPSYLPISILGWSPASENIKIASREIFSELEKILNVEIKENNSPDGFNNFAISQSIQSNSSGLAYFPNNQYQLGSDIFISNKYSDPSTLQNNITNIDYEILLHEIGHALGLKHPFEGDGNNPSILNNYEDQTKFTAMSYDVDPATFNGAFRSLDLMTLTKFYGVSADFRPEDDIYNFDSDTGVFIVDGNGIDTISMRNSTLKIFIDLRPGTQSYEGQKSNFITDARQLTISHGSKVENVETSLGDDTIIGNELPNTIISGAGDDIIFAGEGADVIFPGTGNNTIDLSESEQALDRLVLKQFNESGQFDNIYGFAQGISGDIIDITAFKMPSLTSLPVVDALNAPSAYIDNCIVRIFGEGLNYEDNIHSYLEKDEVLANLKVSDQKQAILITADSQGTGEAQNLFFLEQILGTIGVYHLAHFEGNYLDIDNWSANNFFV